MNMLIWEFSRGLEAGRANCQLPHTRSSTLINVLFPYTLLQRNRTCSKIIGYLCSDCIGRTGCQPVLCYCHLTVVCVSSSTAPFLPHLSLLWQPLLAFYLFSCPLHQSMKREEFNREGGGPWPGSLGFISRRQCQQAFCRSTTSTPVLQPTAPPIHLGFWG
jgi:hypothetical protein